MSAAQTLELEVRDGAVLGSPPVCVGEVVKALTSDPGGSSVQYPRSPATFPSRRVVGNGVSTSQEKVKQ